ncbi:MAG: hypothetical protein GWN87_22715 [Desulfuromonadales bacterium]|nr:hypothetical protein [Desulfuromonadales bacterium]NIS42689.1 hypothetical protein [Desulfuromonadales bacterium]
MQSYTIRRSFLLPLGILLLQVLLLFAIVVAQGQPKSKAIVLGILAIPVVGLFVESFFRRIVVAGEAVTAFRPFRQKSLAYDEITAVDTIQVKKRAFLTVSSEEDFIIISNAYADFPALLESLLEKVPAEKISEDTARMAEAPPVKSSDIVSCWFGVVLLAILMVLQFVR